jgi:hypothetical protein
MGDTVVFTVSLDGDDVTQHLAPRSLTIPTARASLRGTVRDGTWQLSALAALMVPATTAIVSLTVGEPRGVHAEVITVASIVAVAMVVAGATGARSASRWQRTQGAPEARVDTEGPAVATRDRLSIVVGIWVAAWIGTMLAMVPAAPTLAWVAWRSGFGEAQTLPLVGTLAVEIAALAAVGVAVGWWRPTHRPVAIAAAIAVALMILPPLVYTASLPLVTSEDQVKHYAFTVGARDINGRAYPAYICGTDIVSRTRVHTERVWLLLATSPVVAVLDAPDRQPAALVDAPAGTYAALQADLRSARLGPDSFTGYCYQPTSLAPPQTVKEDRFAGAGSMTAAGIAVHALIALATLVFAVSRGQWSR